MLTVILNRRRLNEYLLRHSISQRNFASAVGLSSGYVTQLLKGYRSPSTEARRKLLKATGLKFDDLFTIVPTEEATQ